MATVIDDHFMVCMECLMLIANGDASGMEPDRVRACTAGMDRATAGGRQLVAGDGDQDNDFSWSHCRCCLTTLGGSRHQCVILD